jgi:hypothetical protein
MGFKKRIILVCVLSAYVLATTFVHLLHDHSGCAHSVLSAKGAAVSPHTCGHCRHHSHSQPNRVAEAVNANGEQAPAGNSSAPAHCEDSCFACQFLAVKSIPTVLVAVVEQSEILWQARPAVPMWVSVAGPALPLSRGPPCV